MYYRVILTKNGEYKKTVKKYKQKKKTLSIYQKLKKESEKVQFPKKYINYNKIIPIQYRLYFVKDREEGDKDPYVRDEMGRVKKHEPLFGEYTVIDHAPYYIEETFWVHGYDKNKERKTINDVFEMLTEDITPKGKLIRNVIVVYNKLLIYDEDHFEMVICKCTEDAERLQLKLWKRVKKKKLQKKIVFLGRASSGKTIGQMYDLIQEETGWTMRKIRRRNTRDS